MRDAPDGEWRPHAHNAMNARTATSRSFALAAAARGDLALGLHGQPGGAEQRIAGSDRERAQSSENGVAQSNDPPENAPFSTWTPWIRPPRITPWQNAARVEPAAKAKFQ